MQAWNLRSKVVRSAMSHMRTICLTLTEFGVQPYHEIAPEVSGNVVENLEDEHPI